MPFSRMIVWARAMRLRRSSTPIGGTSPRMFFNAASSASAVEPPTPTVIYEPRFACHRRNRRCTRIFAVAVSPSVAVISTNAADAPNGQLLSWNCP